jgi:2-dehydro-3-deoxygluconokinase
MGIYFLEHGYGPRPAKVVYDRAFSSVSEIRPGEVDWEEVFKEAQWFHWTGITPALSDSTAAVLLEGLKLAKQKGITVSTDLNFRKKLWDEKKAGSVMSGFMPYVDILIGNEEDPTRIFVIKPKGTDIVSGKLNIEGYEELTRTLVDRFGFKIAAITLRKSISASENTWSACLFNGEKFINGHEHHVWIIDRVGTGDAFASGLIYSLIKGKTDEEALSFGIAAACLKHSILGDFNSVSLEEVEKFASGDTTGRVQR